MSTFGYTLNGSILSLQVVRSTFKVKIIEGTEEWQVRDDIESYIDKSLDFSDYAHIVSIGREGEYWVILIEDYLGEDVK